MTRTRIQERKDVRRDADRALRHDILAMFRSGQDTHQIALNTGMTEADALKRLNLARAEECVA